MPLTFAPQLHPASGIQASVDAAAIAVESEREHGPSEARNHIMEHALLAPELEGGARTRRPHSHALVLTPRGQQLPIGVAKS